MCCVAVFVLFVIQQIIILGAVSTQVSPNQMTNLINNLFCSPLDFSSYSDGLAVLHYAGYDGLSFFFLARPLFPILTITVIFVACMIAIHLRKQRKTEKQYKTEERKIVDWIQSDSLKEIDCHFYPDKVIRAIIAQKRLIQKQKDIHNEDSARIMHYMEDITHQLKTPLTVVRVACERLMLQNPSIQSTVETCLGQINKMTKMIQDLLQLGRFDCNKQKMHFTYANAGELLETVANNLNIIAATKNTSIEIFGDPTTIWYCDTHWLKEALGNIIKNCIEHSEDSKIVIQYASNNLSNHITIEDNGSGFETGFEKQIFQRYAFGGKTGKEGTGLGMAIAQEAIKLHYGFVTASNRTEGGAIFRIVFPRFDAETIYS